MLFRPDSKTRNSMICIAEMIYTKVDSNKHTPFYILSEEKLFALSPYSITYETDDTGSPICWFLSIPTTQILADAFLAGDISEKELFELTQPQETYNALYMSSIITVPEYRGKGLAKKLVRDTFHTFRKMYGIERFFYWAYSTEGEMLAEVLQKEGFCIQGRTKEIDDYFII